MALKDTTIIWKINICFQVAAFIISLVGFGSNYLAEHTYISSNVHVGLWQVCNTYLDQCHDTAWILEINKHDSGWVAASKGMMSISLGIHFMCIMISVGSTFITISQMFQWAIAAMEFIAALFGIIGVAVAGAKSTGDFADIDNITYSTSWSFALFLITQFVFVFCGLLHLLDARIKLRSSPTGSTTNIVTSNNKQTSLPSVN